MKKIDLIQLEFLDLRYDVEDWLWLDRDVPQNQSRIEQSLLVVDWLLCRFGFQSELLSESEKAQVLFEKIGEPSGFQYWAEK
jgi:hypothetical protein